MESNSLFLDYTGNKYSQSTQVSLSKGDVVVIEVDRKLLPKFDIKDERDRHVEGLKFWEQELHEAAKEDYLKYSRLIRKDLVTLFGVLRSLYHASL